LLVLDVFRELEEIRLDDDVVDVEWIFKILAEWEEATNEFVEANTWKELGERRAGSLPIE